MDPSPEYNGQKFEIYKQWFYLKFLHTLLLSMSEPLLKILFGDRFWFPNDVVSLRVSLNKINYHNSNTNILTCFFIKANLFFGWCLVFDSWGLLSDFFDGLSSLSLDNFKVFKFFFNDSCFSNNLKVIQVSGIQFKAIYKIILHDRWLWYSGETGHLSMFIFFLLLFYRFAVSIH